jgi:lipoate-protein ligase A
MPPLLRVIVDPPRSAAFNMAEDLLLLDRTAADRAVYLRFYGWDPPAISLGCMQDPGALLDLAAMSASGIDWIKRPTGGRAILHWNDLTYAVAFPASLEEMGSTINESYAMISRCLMAGLARAGIRCESHDSAVEYAATRREIKLPCFLSPNRNEIMVKGKKLIGSAQKRTDRAVLQHGSIPLDGRFRKLPEFFNLDGATRSAQMQQLEEKCACVGEINPGIDAHALTRHLINGFATNLVCEVRNRE